MSIGIRYKPRVSKKATRDSLASVFGVAAAAQAIEETTPKKRRARPEDLLHFAVAKYLRRAIAHEGQASRHGATWRSEEARNVGKNITTNRGKSINLEAINRKARGCIAGVPDIEIIYQGRCHRIELKAEAGVLSEAQIAYHRILKECGARVVVCRSVEEVQAAIEGWGIPLTARVFA